MDKHQIYAFLQGHGIWHEVTEHAAVYNMAEASALALPYPEADAKNLFVRDEKHEKLLYAHRPQATSGSTSRPSAAHTARAPCLLPRQRS